MAVCNNLTLLVNPNIIDLDCCFIVIVVKYPLIIYQPIPICHQTY